jgi:hypothetical protein
MALTRTNEEVAEDAQQRQILAQQQMQAASQEAATLRQLADIQPLAPQQPTRLPIDWQHGADRAAARAANLEQMQLQHQQRLAEIAAQEQADRESLAYKMQMQAKYAPKRTGGGGGAGYLSKLQKEYMDTFINMPAEPTQAQRTANKLSALEASIKRSGASGRQFLEDFHAGSARGYVPSGVGTKAQLSERSEETKAKTALEVAAARKGQEQTGVRDSDRIRALSAVVRAADKDFSQEARKRAQEAAAELQRIGVTTAAPATAPAAPARTAPSQTVQLPPVTETKTINGKKYEKRGGSWYSAD